MDLALLACFKPVVLIPVAYVMWQGHTKESRANAVHVERALRECGISKYEAAEMMGISEPQLSRQLSGVEHLSAHRLQSLPKAFHLLYDEIRAGRHEELHVIRDERLGEWMRFLDRVQVRMLKMEHYIEQLTHHEKEIA